jgi:hypothetical protein
VDEIDGDGATGLQVFVRRQYGGDLNESATPHEIRLKRRTHRIPAPGGSRDLTAPFPADGVIHGHDEGFLRTERLEGLPANYIK